MTILLKGHNYKHFLCKSTSLKFSIIYFYPPPLKKESKDYSFHSYIIYDLLILHFICFKAALREGKNKLGLSVSLVLKE